MTPSLSRRSFLVAGAAAGTLLVCGVRDVRSSKLDPAPLASSRVTADGCGARNLVLCTRLTWGPLRGGGSAAEPVPVRWEVAADEHLQNIVHRGIVTTCPDSGHDVSVKVHGLWPDRLYWYRFRTQPEEIPTDPSGAPRRLRFAFIRCEDSENGYLAYEGGPRMAPPHRNGGIEIVSHFRTVATA